MIVRAADGPVDARFVVLARSFPVLERHAPGLELESMDLGLVDAWAAHNPDEVVIQEIIRNGGAPFPGRGAVEAARFVLNVWSSSHAWACGRFDLFRAFRVWDHEQLGAFRAWTLDPFFP